MRRRFPAVANGAGLGDQQVVEHQHLFAIGGREVVWLARLHQQVAVEAEVLQDVLAMMRVIPVDAGIGEMHLVVERLAGRDRLLGDMRHPVEAIVQAQAVPVDRRGEVSAVGKSHGDRRRLVHLNERPGILAVEAKRVDVRPNNTRRTGAASSASVSPSFMRTSSRGRASGAVGSASGRYDDTSGLRDMKAGGIDTCGCIGGGVQSPAGLAGDVLPAGAP